MRNKISRLGIIITALFIWGVFAESSFASVKTIDQNEFNEVLVDCNIDFDTLDIISANVNQNTSDKLVQTLEINKGETDGVLPGMIVISENGLVGYIGEVSSATATVYTLLHPSNPVACKVVRTHDTGILTTNELIDEHANYTLMYLPATTDVSFGDMVITSGDDQHYPHGIRVGYVIDDPYEDSHMDEDTMSVLLVENLIDINEVYILPNAS